MSQQVITPHTPTREDKFASDSAVAIQEDVSGPLEDVKDLVYSKEDDAAIEQWLRENVNTTWHSLGTCKMAPREKDGVVDGSLNVHGVKGLKIADLSIPPENVGGNKTQRQRWHQLYSSNRRQSE